MVLRKGKTLPDPQPSAAKGKGKEVEAPSKKAPSPPAVKAFLNDRVEKVDDNIIGHLKKIPALLSVYDALMLSSDIRTAFVQALLDPDKYQSHFAEVNMKEALYAQYSAAVTFTDDDLMLKTTEHNRPMGRLTITRSIASC